MKQLGIDWPVLVDSDYKNWSAFRNNFWPRHFFIDMHGNIVADHSGEGDYAESERIIQKLLQQANPNLELPVPLAPLRSEDVPGARCYPMTPEIYAGVRGFHQGQLANVAEYIPGETANFTPPAGELQDGRIYLVGNWRTEEESLRHGRATTDFANGCSSSTTPLKPTRSSSRNPTNRFASTHARWPLRQPCRPR